MPVFTTNVMSFCVATAIDDNSHDDKDLAYLLVDAIVF